MGAPSRGESVGIEVSSSGCLVQGVDPPWGCVGLILIALYEDRPGVGSVCQCFCTFQAVLLDPTVS
jgi:hypothetical protein